MYFKPGKNYKLIPCGINMLDSKEVDKDISLSTMNLTKGNINIAPSVSHLVGAFYSEGKISTGDDSGAPNQLEVPGLMIAKDFDFQRTYINPLTKTGAERIIYDGRISANTPPGFQDISRSLPLWNEAAP